jgi:hypothetical protein
MRPARERGEVLALRWSDVKGTGAFIERSAPEPDSDTHEAHEIQFARYIAVAFIAHSHGIGTAYACKKYAYVPVGAFRVDIARQVIVHKAQRGDRTGVTATIQ